MKYVLDASVGLKWVLTEPDSPKAVEQSPAIPLPALSR